MERLVLTLIGAWDKISGQRMLVPGTSSSHYASCKSIIRKGQGKTPVFILKLEGKNICYPLILDRT